MLTNGEGGISAYDLVRWRDETKAEVLKSCKEWFISQGIGGPYIQNLVKGVQNMNEMIQALISRVNALTVTTKEVTKFKMDSLSALHGLSESVRYLSENAAQMGWSLPPSHRWEANSSLWSLLIQC